MKDDKPHSSQQHALSAADSQTVPGCTRAKMCVCEKPSKSSSETTTLFPISQNIYEEIIYMEWETLQLGPHYHIVLIMFHLMWCKPPHQEGMVAREKKKSVLVRNGEDVCRNLCRSSYELCASYLKHRNFGKQGKLAHAKEIQEASRRDGLHNASFCTLIHACCLLRKSAEKRLSLSATPRIKSPKDLK